MNIGIFTDTYYPQINGVVTSTRMLEKELNKRGHKVYIFTTTDPHASAAPRVFRLPSMRFVFLPTHRVTFMYSPKLLLKIKMLNLDIVHTQTEFPLGFFGKIVSEFYRIPHVHTFHTMYEDYVHYILNGHLITPKMAQRFSRIFCNGSKAVIAPVDKTKQYLIDSGVVRPISVIPTGIDFAPFDRNKYSEKDIIETKKSLGLNLYDPLVVTVGRIAKEKSIDVVIKQMPELLKRLPAAKFVIIGDGPMREELQNLSKKLGVENSVVFAGSKPWDSLGKYYMLGDAFVTASTSETQGLTHIEAMAAKVPVVVKRDKSFEGVVIHEKTGYCFDSDNETAGVLYRVLTNKEEARELANNAYNGIQSMSSAQFAKKVEELYMEVLRGYKPKKYEALLKPDGGFVNGGN